MIDPVNLPQAEGRKAIRSWAGGVFEMLVEARREETKRALARVLWTQCVPTLEGVDATAAITCVAPTWPQVERRGPNRATNVVRLPGKSRSAESAMAKSAAATATRPQAQRKVANGKAGEAEWEQS